MIRYAFASDIGKVREKNEDSTVVLENSNHDILMLVLDGMGGHSKGDIASKMTLNSISESFFAQRRFTNYLSMKNFLRKSIRKAVSELRDYVKLNPESKGMGCTLSAYLIHQEKIVVCYIGDSRAYIIKDGGIKQLSEDETYVQYLVNTGKITEEEKLTHPSRHIVTNAISCEKNAFINIDIMKEDFDYLLLCSDGLYNLVEDYKICSIVEDHEEDVEKATKELIKQANKKGGTDNISVAVLYKGVQDD